MTDSPTGRLGGKGPNIQSLPVRTPEGTKVRDALVRACSGGQAQRAWEDACRELDAEERLWDEHLIRRYNVAAIHADDGWVDRERNRVRLPSYTRYRRPLIEVGDVVALGRSDKGFRLVRVDSVDRSVFGIWYGFTEIGRADGPAGV